MNNTCPFFIKKNYTVTVRELHATSRLHNLTYWCSHGHSPVLEKHSICPGGAHLLKCNGLMDNCQIPIEFRGDCC